MRRHQSAMEYFVQLVRETAQWCALRANTNDPKHSLRSPELATPTPFDIWYPKIKLEHPRNDSESFTVFAQQLNVLTKRRRELLALQRPTTTANGRLLIYSPHDSDFSSAAAADSKWFFDGDDCPPWDTWICIVRAKRPPSEDPHFYRDMEILICWIPEVFFPLAQEGIAGCFMECVDWIDAPRNPYYGGLPLLESLHHQWQSAQTE